MQHLGFKSITFFYPSRIVGGAEYLFFRLSRYLIENHDVEVNYIDFEDGVVKMMLSDNNLSYNYINYTGYNHINVPDESVIISPLSSLYEISIYLRGNFRILLWSIHPSGLFDSYLSNSKYKIKINTPEILGKDIDYIIGKGSVYFMDESNFEYQREIFKFSSTPTSFLPIFCENRLSSLKQVDKKNINLGWIGRLSIDKIHSLINVVNHCIYYSNLHKDVNFTIHIIGDGGEKYKLEELVIPDNISLKYLGTLIDDDLTNYVNKNFDVAFAMGTSALELGLMKKAVILLDFLYKPFPKNNKFRWLFDAKNYNVAEKYDKELLRDVSFSQIIDSVINEEHFAIGDKCNSYVKSNHSIDAVGKVILKALSEAKLTVNDLNNTNFKVSFVLKKMKFAKRYLKKYL